MQLKVKVNDKWSAIPATTEIADDIISDKLTYSSKKIEELLANKINKSEVGNGLKLKNQELSVNTEDLDISKATVEDAVEGIDKTELISLIKTLVKDNLQIESVSTGLKFENGVLSLDIANGDNLKYGTSK